MVKKVKKSRITFTMEESIINEFENHIEENSLNRSKLIVKLIKEYLKKNINIKN